MKRTLLTLIAVGVVTVAAPNVVAEPLVAESGVDFAFDPTAVALVDTQDDAAAEASQDGSLQTNATRIVDPFGAKGSKRWTIQGGYSTNGQSSDNWSVQAGLGLSYFFLDGVSINVDLHGNFYNQIGSNAGGIGLDLLLRWHFINERTWSIYGDVGAGVLGTTDKVPTNGSSFNFTPQAGLGATFALGDSENRIMVGARWVHISNAGLYADNPGRDTVLVYAGLTIPF